MSEIKLLNNNSLQRHEHLSSTPNQNQFLFSENSFNDKNKKQPRKELKEQFKFIDEKKQKKENYKYQKQVKFTKNVQLQQNQNPEIKNISVNKNQSYLSVSVNDKNESFREQTPLQPKQQQINKKQKVDKIISNLNANAQKLNANLSQMKNNCDQLEIKQLLIKNKGQHKQKLFEQFLSRKHKQNVNKKRNKQKSLEVKKLQQSQTINAQQLSRTARAKYMVGENLRKLAQLRQKKQREKSIQDEQSRRVAEMYEKIHDEQKINKKFYIRKMQEDEQKKSLQSKKYREMLQRRRQAYKSIDIAELDEHRRRYEQIASQLSKAKRQKRDQQMEFIQSANMKIHKLYKGDAHDVVRQELEEIKAKRQEPKQKYNKIKEYQKYVYLNYLPKTHQPVKKSFNEPSSPRRNRSHKQIKRYKYLNGVAHGEILELKPIAKTQAQQRNMGNQYLQYLKTLPKKREVLQSRQISLTSEDVAILQKKFNSITRVKIQKNPLYERVGGRKSVDIKISQNPTRQQLDMVIKQLKSKDQQTKLKQKLIVHQGETGTDISKKHKQVNDQIIGNIERKLNLLAKL